jgi:hypothetical protein
MFHFYFDMLARTLSQPRQLFSRLPEDMGLKKSFAFLTISSSVFSAASMLTGFSGIPFLWAGLCFVNAVGMTLIAAGLGYVLVFTLKGGRDVVFHEVFRIYAISSGTTLLAAWIPLFVVITEPWKWWLIGTGMTRSCRLSVVQTLLVIGLSIGIMVGAFRLALPLTFSQAVTG